VTHPGGVKSPAIHKYAAVVSFCVPMTPGTVSG
jgi:hypothetical protein